MRQLLPSARSTTIGLVAAAMLGAGILANGLLNAKAHAGGAPGALTPKGCVDDTTAGPDNCARSAAGLQTGAATAVSRDGKSVYVASEASTLVRFKRDTKSGALTPRGCFEDLDAGLGACRPVGGLSGAGSVVVSGDGKSVYVASEGDSAVAIFKRDTQSGALTPKGCVQDAGIVGGDCTQSAPGLEGASFAVVTADGRSVYATSSNGSIVRFKRDEHSGALTPGGCMEDPMNAAGCTQTAAGLNGAGALAVSADNKSVYVSSENGAIVSFKRDETNGKLTPKGCIQDSDNVQAVCPKDTQGLGGTEAIAVSDDGRSVYAVSGFDSAIVRFDRNTHTGVLTPRGCIQDHDVAPICSKHASGMEEGAGVAISHDGKSVYYGSGTDDAIVSFKRDKTNGKLTPKGCIDDNDTLSDPTQGEDNCADSTNGLAKLTSVAISRDGKSVYTTSEIDGAISRFKRKTG